MTDSGRHDPPEGQEKSQRVQQLVFDVARRRSGGEDVSDEALIGAHPDLMPELEEELRRLRLVEAARAKAGEAAPAAPTRPDSDRAAEAARQRDEQNKDAASPRSRGLHVRCPHCHNPIEVVVDTPLADVTCRACGSHFSLVDSGRETRTASKVRTIGHFDLIEQLGRGSFGTVWKAYDRELERTVAVKIPRQGQISPAEAESFLEEARNAARVSHPNIVAVHEVGRDGEDVYIVSDIVRGVKLSDWLSAKQPAPREAAKLCAKIARALHCAHEAGVVHRDLKPQNIMIDADGDPHLMDFGLAKREAGEITMTVEGKILGTAAYIPPEQARGESHQADRRADIYSLGVILFELLTGERPFRGTEPMLIHQAVYDEAPSPRKLNNNVPKDLETICLKCLPKEPRARYQTAAELGDELERYLDGEPIQARPLGLVGRTWRWSRRYPARATVCALGILLIAGMIAVPIAFYIHTADYNRRLLLEQAKTSRALQERTRALALSTLTEAQSLCEQGKIAEGLLLLTKGFTIAQNPETGDLEEVFRFNLDSWSRELHQLVQVLDHPGRVNAVQVSPDGAMLATACDDGKVRIWTLTHGAPALDEPTLVLDYREDAGSESQAGDAPAKVTSLAFHPLGKSLLAGYTDGKARLWGLASRTIVRTIVHIVSDKLEAAWRWPHDRGISSVAFSPDGCRFATAGYDGYARVWSAETYEELSPKGALKVPCWISDVAFCAHGEHLAATGWENSITVWNVEKGTEVSKLLTPGNMYFSVDVDCRRGRIAAGSLQDQTAEQWLVDGVDAVERTADSCPFRPAQPQFGEPAPRRFTLERTFRHSGWVTCTEYSPDGALLLTTSTGNSAHVWNAETGEQVGTVMRHPTSVTAGCFAPAGRTIFTACEDGTVRIWRLAQTNRIHVLPHGCQVRDVDLSKDGSKLATSVARMVKCYPYVWETLTGEQVVGRSFPVVHWTSDVQYSPDGRTVFIGEEGKQLVTWFDVDTGKKEGSVSTPDRVWHMVLSDDGSTLLVGSDRVYVFTVELGRPTTVTPTNLSIDHQGERSALAITSDNRIIVTGGKRETIQFWDAETGKRLNSFSTGIKATALAVRSLGPDSGVFRLVVGGEDGAIRLFEFDGELLSAVGTPMNQMGQINDIAFARDCSLIVTCSDDYTARVWHECGKAIGPPLHHDKRVSAVDANDPRGLLATGSLDETAAIWRMPSRMIGDIDRIELYVTSITGMDFDDHGVIRVLEGKQWRERMQTPLGREVIEQRREDQEGTRVQTLLAEVRRMSRANSNEKQAIVAEVEEYLSSRIRPGLEPRDFLLARALAGELIRAGDQQMAAEAHRRFARLLAGANDEQAQLYRRLFEGFAIRIELLGTELELSGATIDGSRFDWANYRGKVVLVNFWASWCDPCRVELTRLKKYHELYHAVGFDVVGISLDHDRDALEAFLKREELPWATLYDRDAQGRRPIAEYYGVATIPTAFLVDAEGKVVSSEAQGPQLLQLLTKALGPPDAICEQYAASRQWTEAIPIYRTLVELEPNNRGRHRDLAVIQLQAGDLEGYRDTCQEAFARFARGNVFHQAYLAQLCCLSPQSGVDREEVARVAAEAREQNDNTTMRLAKGMAEYRCGRFEEALRALPDSGDDFQVPMSLLFQAMAHHQLGREEQARALFRRAREECRRRVPEPVGPAMADYMPPRWIVWCMLDVARREAAGMIPDPAWEHVEKSDDLIQAGKLAEAVEELSIAVEIEPEFPQVLLRRGSVRARLGQWKLAAEDYVKGLEVGTPEDLDWLRAAPLLVLAEDSMGYREHCTRMLASAKDLDNLPATEQAIKACLLIPDQVPIGDLPLASLEQALDNGSAPNWFLAWGYTTRALAAYRKSEPEAALRWIAKAETTVAHAENPNLRALALTIKALAQHRLDQGGEARQSLDEAARMIDEELPKLATGSFTGGWHDWLIAEVIRREADKLIKPPAEKTE